MQIRPNSCAAANHRRRPTSIGPPMQIRPRLRLSFPDYVTETVRVLCFLRDSTISGWKEIFLCARVRFRNVVCFWEIKKRLRKFPRFLKKSLLNSKLKLWKTLNRYFEDNKFRWMRLCKEKSNLFDPLLFLFLSFTRISTLNSEQSRFLEVFTTQF